MIREHSTAIRRGFILGVVAAMFGFALVYPHVGSDGAANTAEVAVPDPRPNVIVIMTDDMRVDDLDAMDKTTNLLAGEILAGSAPSLVPHPGRILVNAADSGGAFDVLTATTPAASSQAAMSCVLIFAFVWLIFLGLALLTFDVWRVLRMHLEGIEP
jgi:hypothetical protein